ncbi:T9SS sorting signal type C domain-containing protein [Flavobacterium sp. TMP13]|uniref:T9SS sorting signal type C domain-containing protein n=1 Tax=Flavobacterium sp. TMP13 TaxID=3425950 RepID=UPI003D78767D
MAKKLPFSTNSLNFQHFGLLTEKSGTLRSKLLLAFILFIVFQISGNAATFYSRMSGNWNANAIWSYTSGGASVGAGIFPKAGDIVYIETSHTVTVPINVPAFCASITFTANGSTVSTLSVASALTISGAIIMNSKSGQNRSHVLTGDGTISCSSVQIGTADPTYDKFKTILTSTIANFIVSSDFTLLSSGGNGTNTINAEFYFQSGTLDINGRIITTNQIGDNTSIFSTTTGAQTGTLLLSNANPFNLSGTGTNTITLNGTGATVNYDGVGQAIRTTAYTNLTLSGSASKTLAATTTVSNNLTLSGTAKLAPSVLDIISNGAKVIFNGGSYATGGVNETLGTITLNDNSTIDLSGTSQTNFANSATIPWSGGKILTITGWNSSRKVLVGINGSSLTTDQISQIKFQLGGVPVDAILLSTGELVPDPCSSVATPTVGTIVNITCSDLGTVALSNLPAGSWTINQSGPINTTILGSGTAYTVPNLSAGSYTFTVTANGCTSAATLSVPVVDNSSTTWNGNAWSNGSPTATKNAIIASVSPNPPPLTGFTACGLTINAGLVVTVPSGVTLTITKGVNVTTDNGLIFENNASLVQIADVQNTGKITYKRNTTPMRRYDFTYWSSPVAGMTLNQLSPNTLYDKYLKYSNGWSESVNGVQTMNPASGYAVRAPQSFDLTTATVYNAVFEGIPNNGTIEFQLNGTWNLIGNPYPSAVYADKFIDGNSNLYGTLYFWEHNSLPSTLQPGTATYNYNSGDYASYNITGGVGTGVGTKALTGSKIPSGYIAAGQSFFIAATESLPSVSFKNDMRVPGQNSQFFKMTKKPTVEKNRIWLNLTNEDGLFKQLLIGYLSGATNAYDMVYDGVTYNGNAYADFYSINNGAKLAIQGRAVPFTDEEIPLGFRVNLAKKPAVPNSMFTISIDHTDGSLDNQSVFLFDNVENKTHNLRKGDYSFSSADGTFDNRFVLKYTNKTLGVDDFEQQNKMIKVSVKNKVITIAATTHTIEKVLIYDVSGKTIYSKSKINSSVFEIANLRSSDQVLLVKLQLENGITQTTKIIF